MKLYQIAFRNVLRNKRRSVLSGVAIAISALIIVFFYGFINGMMDDVKKNTFEYVSGHIKVVNKDYGKNTGSLPVNLGVERYAEALEGIEELPGVIAATPRIMFGTMIFGSPRIAKTDVKDYSKLASLIADAPDRVSSFIAGKLPDAVRESLSGDRSVFGKDAGATIALLDALNDVMRRSNLYGEGLIGDGALSEETKSVIGKSSMYQDTTLVNRLVLEDAFPEVIEKSPRLGKTYGSLGYGFDFEREKAFTSPGKYVTEGTVPSPGSNGILLSSGLAASMKLSVGDKLTLFTKTRYSGSNAGTYRVTGIVHFPVFVFNQKSFFLPMDAAADLLQLGDTATEILVITNNEQNLARVSSGISSVLEGKGITDATLEPWNESGFVFSYIRLIDISFLFLSLFFFLLGTTVIINTTMMVIYERMREIGTVSAMGMTGGEIVLLFFLEAFIISSIAAFAGVILGTVVVQILNATGFPLETLGRGINMEFSSVIYPSANPLTSLFVYLYAVVVSSLVSLVPSRHASRIEPVEALRSV